VAKVTSRTNFCGASKSAGSDPHPPPLWLGLPGATASCRSPCVINESRGTRVTAFYSPGFLIIASVS
jgi:hypothetical protein